MATDRPWALCALLVLSTAAGTCGGQQNAPFLVNGERKQAVIVVGPSLHRKERNAPKDLGRYLEQVTGASVPVRKTAAGPGGLTIHVGRSKYVDRQGLDLDGLHIDGYAIKLVDANNLVIAGGKHLGTGFGVYDFLKHVCGARWFMPGPLGEVVPKRDAVKLDALDIRSEPSVHSVWLRPIHIDNLKAKHFRRYHWAGHNLKRLVPPATFAETHPEYYALIGDKRRVPKGKRPPPWQPCVSNPDLPSLVPDVARAHFKKYPFSRVFSMGVNDGGGDCLCDTCTAMDRIAGGRRIMSDRYMAFYNRCADEFAKAFPDKLLGFHAYGGVREAPSSVAPRDNIYVRIGGEPNVFGRIDGWHAKVKHLGLYDFVYGTLVLEPRHYPHVLGRYVKRLARDYGLLSFSAEVFPFWPFDAPKYYVLSELLWDVDQDVDALLDDYFTAFYREAAGPMKAFFQRMEDVYERRDDPYHFFDGYRRGGFRGWQDADVAAMNARMDRAKRLAVGEPVKARVRTVDEAWQHIRCWIAISICRDALASMDVRSRKDADRVIEYGRAIERNMKERAEWDRRVGDRSRYPTDKGYYEHYVARHYAKPGPLVETATRAENALEHACDKVTDWPGWTREDAAAFWSKLVREDKGRTRLGVLGDIQLRRIGKGGAFGDVVVDDNLEDVSRKRPPLTAKQLETYRWGRVKDLPPEYSVWSYTGLPATFVWTDSIARSGKRCLGITRNESRTALMRVIAVRPRERYRVSAAATRVYPKDDTRDIHPTVTIAWQRERGWSPAARLTASIPVTVSGKWHSTMLCISVPDGAARMVIMMGINGSQFGEAGTYFDDLRVVRTHSPD